MRGDWCQKRAGLRKRPEDRRLSEFDRRDASPTGRTQPKRVSGDLGRQRLADVAREILQDLAVSFGRWGKLVRRPPRHYPPYRNCAKVLQNPCGRLSMLPWHTFKRV